MKIFIKKELPGVLADTEGKRIGETNNYFWGKRCGADYVVYDIDYIKQTPAWFSIKFEISDFTKYVKCIDDEGWGSVEKNKIYRIVERLDPLTFALMGDNGFSCKVMHSNMLKCFVPAEESEYLKQFPEFKAGDIVKQDNNLYEVVSFDKGKLVFTDGKEPAELFSISLASPDEIKKYREDHPVFPFEHFEDGIEHYWHLTHRCVTVKNTSGDLISISPKEMIKLIKTCLAVGWIKKEDL